MDATGDFPPMIPIHALANDALAWHEFYVLVGAAAATLTGLMFVAVTFGSSLVKPETSATARSFLDPTFNHFAQVLLTACLMTVPTMGHVLLGSLLFMLSLLRMFALIRIHRHMKEAARTHQDIELSDWVAGIVVPFVCHLLLGASGVAFMARSPLAFDGLAIATVVILFNGVFGAWELMVWMAVTRTTKAPETAPPSGAAR
jgi:hypothetical protein